MTDDPVEAVAAAIAENYCDSGVLCSPYKKHERGGKGSDHTDDAQAAIDALRQMRWVPDWMKQTYSWEPTLDPEPVYRLIPTLPQETEG